MTFRTIGVPISTAEQTANSVTQPFIPSTNRVIKGLVAGIIFTGNPSFTDLRMEVWTDRGGVPGGMLAQSLTVWTKADLMTLDHGFKTVGFTFNTIKLRANNTYHAVLRISGYTGTTASHIAWRKSYPDPQYQVGVTFEVPKGAHFPLELSIIGERP